jgi:hypothetical protein
VAYSLSIRWPSSVRCASDLSGRGSGDPEELQRSMERRTNKLFLQWWKWIADPEI